MCVDVMVAVRAVVHVAYVMDVEYPMMQRRAGIVDSDLVVLYLEDHAFLIGKLEQPACDNAWSGDDRHLPFR